MADPYQQLASYLDSLPAGYPPTDSGVELCILRKLFTPQEANLALHLTLIAGAGACGGLPRPPAAGTDCR